VLGDQVVLLAVGVVGFEHGGGVEVGQQPRGLALTKAQAASPLARRPYDLRHGAASLWLNVGVPPTEVARRLGHSVAVLLRVYANCVDGDQDVVNERIALALSASAGRGTLAPAPVEQHGSEPARAESPCRTPAARACLPTPDNRSAGCQSVS
jgi:hypothetical protein